MILSRLFRSGAPSRAIGLYRAIVIQARQTVFYSVHGVPDSVDGRYEMIALHVFLVLQQLKASGEGGLAQDLFDTMFADMDQSLREMGAGDLGVGRRVRAMAEGLYGRIAAYEAGLAGNDENSRGGSAPQSVWHCFRARAGRGGAIRALPLCEGGGGSSAGADRPGAQCRIAPLSLGTRKSMMRRNASAPEFSRPVEVDRIGHTEVVHDISANAAECMALAQRFDLRGIDKLQARLRLRRARGGSVLRLAGHLTADVAQACVVTLVPVPSHVESEFTVLYGGGEAGGEGIDIDPDIDATLEPWPEGPLDLGEIVAQELALALDPYPRAPGAALDPAYGPSGGPAVEMKRVNPFMVLQNLRKRPK